MDMSYKELLQTQESSHPPIYTSSSDSSDEEFYNSLDNVAAQALVRSEADGPGAPGSRIYSEKWQNLLAYWLLGLTNNLSYVVMLSAAHDILSNDYSNTTHISISLHGNDTNPERDCNSISTGAILLADILPALIIKLLAPFIPTYMHVRVLISILSSTACFFIVGETTSRALAVVGVAFASFSSGLGEVTFLGYSSYFHRNVISTWSSGTGGAGLFGSLGYAALTTFGMTPHMAVLSMLVVPLIMAFSFWVLLKPPASQKCYCWKYSRGVPGEYLSHEGSSILSECNTLEYSLSLAEKLEWLPNLFKYMLPLGLVYVAEYLINQGLFELVYFPEISKWLNHHEQYRWYQVIYQVGVLVSRSSVNVFHLQQTWIATVLQWLNVVLFMTVAVYWWVGSIWIIFVLIFWEGLLGGAAYVNTFYRIANEVPESKKCFSMSVTSISDSLGITVAGFMAMPLHNAICRLPL